MPRLEITATFDCPPAVLFDFLNDPRNRALVSPPDVHFELREAPATFAEGSRFTFEVRAYGQRQKFTHEITAWERPVGYTETQVAGPFGAMRHVRGIEPAGTGARLVETVDFDPPSGLLGFLLNEGRLRKLLGDGFEHQHRELARLLAGGNGRPAVAEAGA
jgi:ligand-binding SRPBCC domain-containing protein